MSLAAMSPLERFRAGRGVLPPNRWFQPLGGHGKRRGFWTCFRWDCEQGGDGRWRLTLALTHRHYPIEGRAFDTAEAAMEAADIHDSQAW